MPATRRSRTSSTALVNRSAEPIPDSDPLLSFTPYEHKRPRKNSITPRKQRKFIAHLAATGVVARAAMHIGVSLEALYKLRKKPGAEGFAAAWDAAVERGVDRLEENALSRAIDGEAQWKVAPDGGIITYDRKYNENLVMFFLRNRRPEKYSAHLKPGHPVYERIRAEVLAEQAEALPSKEQMLASLNALVEAMREQDGAAPAMLEEDGEQNTNAS